MRKSLFAKISNTRPQGYGFVVQMQNILLVVKVMIYQRINVRKK